MPMLFCLIVGPTASGSCPSTCGRIAAKQRNRQLDFSSAFVASICDGVSPCLRRQQPVANRGSQAIHVHRKSDEFCNRGFDLPPPLGGCMVDSQQEFRITNQTEFQNLIRALTRGGLQVLTS